MPLIESTIRKSKDGQYIIHRTTITHIRPRAYYEAVLSDAPAEQDVETDDIEAALQQVAG